MSEHVNPSESLESRWAALQREYAHAREGWSDTVALRFETEFWSEWQATLPGAIEMLRRLEGAIATAETASEEE